MKGLSIEHRNILEVLKQHKGAACAIKKDCLAQLVNMRPRTLEENIRQMIIERGIGIASSTRAPYGYFIIETDAEHRAYRAQLISRIRSCNERLMAVDKSMARRIQAALFEITDEDLADAPSWAR